MSTTKNSNPDSDQTQSPKVCKHKYAEKRDGSFGIEGHAVPYLECSKCHHIKFYDADIEDGANTFTEYMRAYKSALAAASDAASNAMEAQPRKLSRLAIDTLLSMSFGSSWRPASHIDPKVLGELYPTLIEKEYFLDYPHYRITDLGRAALAAASGSATEGGRTE